MKPIIQGLSSNNTSRIFDLNKGIKFASSAQGKDNNIKEFDIYHSGYEKINV